MKLIQQHPRMKDIIAGDEVYCYRNQIFAQVEEVFPAAVCVKLMIYNRHRRRFQMCPLLWRAEDIENLSVCRYCGGREGLIVENDSGAPYRSCTTCRNVLNLDLPASIVNWLDKPYSPGSRTSDPAED